MRIFGAVVLFAIAGFASHGAAHCFTATLNWKDDGGTPLAPAHDVPVPVRISTELIDGFNYAETANGTNFEIADESGSILPYEIDVWNPSGESLLWVKVPDCHDGQVLTIVYGRTNADMMAYSSRVWGGYAGVWHMNEVLARDSASGHYDGQMATGVTLNNDGRIGSSLSFDGDYEDKVFCSGVSCGEVLPNSRLTGGMTVSCWVNPSTYSGERAFFGKKGLISMRFSSESAVTVTTPDKKNFAVTNLTLQAVGEWCHLTVTFYEFLVSDHADVRCFVYTNGVAAGSYVARVYGSSNIGYTDSENSTEMFLGRNQWDIEPFKGEIDELRFLPCVMTADDIAATYAAMTKATFSYGAVRDVAVPSVGGTYYHFTATVSNAVMNASGQPFENMPVLLKLAEGKPAGFSYNDVVNSGRDFEITGESGNALPYEIDTWNPGGESLLWVRVPSFENGRRITVTYGRSLSDGTASAALVWNDYAGVWHLGTIDYLASAFGTYPDSTAGGGHDGAKAKMSYVVATNGAIGASVRIAENNDAYKVVDSNGDAKICYGGVFVDDSDGTLDIGPSFTISGWFRYDGSECFRYDKFFFKRDNANNNEGARNAFAIRLNAKRDSGRGDLCVYGSGNDSGATTAIPSIYAGWTHLTFVYNESSCLVYTNGIRRATKEVSPVEKNTERLCFGNKNSGFGDGVGENSWNGWIDEVRLVRRAVDGYEVKAEFVAMSGEVFDCGSVVTNANDATTPTFGAAPTFAWAGDNLVFSVPVTGGKGTVFAEYVDVYTGEAVTNEIATLTGGSAFSLTIADTPFLAANHTYSFAAIAQNTAGTHVVRMPGHGTVYFGELGVAAVRDADEAWLHKPESNGVFRISRAEDAWSTSTALDVSFVLSGTAIERNTAAHAGSGLTVTIPVGASFVDVEIAPFYCMLVTDNTDITLTVVNSNVKNPSHSTATLTVKNTTENLLERFVSPNGSDDNLGTSPAQAMRLPTTAVDAIRAATLTEPAVVHVASGLYPVTRTMDLKSPIRVIGEGATPADVVISNSVAMVGASVKVRRLAALDSAGALLVGVTLQNAWAATYEASDGYCFTVNVSGGMVSNCVVEGCSFSCNESHPAVWVWGPNSLVTHTAIRDVQANVTADPWKPYVGNLAVALHFAEGARVENCLIKDVHTERPFPIVRVNGASSILRNCTIVDSTAAAPKVVEYMSDDGTNKTFVTYGTPLYVNDSNPRVVNVAIAGVRDLAGNLLPPVGETNSEGRAQMSFYNCAVDTRPGFVGDDWFSENRNVLGTTASFFRGYGRGDYQPRMGGPLVNAGTNYENMAATDLAGKPRKVERRIDIGCYESGRSKLQISIR